MEVLVHSPPSDHFDFNGARINSPYLSAPSSPKRFGDCNYLSAPTSPSRFYTEFDDYFSASPSALHDWEHKSNNNNNNDDGFAFFVTGESETPSRSAAELFYGGKIKPLKQDQLFESAKSPLLSPTRSKISQGKKSILQAFSPRKKKESREREALGGERRGRDRTPVAEISSSNSGRRVTRSHSPYRISHWDEESNQRQRSNKEESVHKLSSTDSSTSSKSSRKWRLRDFLLFRSASEGRGTNKDPFRKYPVLYKKAEEVKALPIRSRRKEPVSAHELHYARKKAETEDLKKKTFLPYKQGILGRLAGFK